MWILKNRVYYLSEKKGNQLSLTDFTDKKILQAFKITGLHNGYSHFSPLWIKEFIKQFNVKSIYDPCGGWGHRLLGAYDIEYHYNDIDMKTVKGCKNMSNHFKLNNKYFYNNDASLSVPNIKVDAVFTCPPYFNVEKYTHENTSTKKYPLYKDWLNVWWNNVVKQSLKTKPKYFAYVINNKFLNDTKEICENNGLILEFETTVGANISNHFQKKQNINKKSEVLLVLKC